LPTVGCATLGAAPISLPNISLKTSSAGVSNSLSSRSSHQNCESVKDFPSEGEIVSSIKQNSETNFSQLRVQARELHRKFKLSANPLSSEIPLVTSEPHAGSAQQGEDISPESPVSLLETPLNAYKRTKHVDGVVLDKVLGECVADRLAGSPIPSPPPIRPCILTPDSRTPLEERWRDARSDRSDTGRGNLHRLEEAGPELCTIGHHVVLSDNRIMLPSRAALERRIEISSIQINSSLSSLSPPKQPRAQEQIEREVPTPRPVSFSGAGGFRQHPGQLHFEGHAGSAAPTLISSADPSSGDVVTDLGSMLHEFEEENGFNEDRAHGNQATPASDSEEVDVDLTQRRVDVANPNKAAHLPGSDGLLGLSDGKPASSLGIALRTYNNEIILLHGEAEPSKSRSEFLEGQLPKPGNKEVRFSEQAAKKSRETMSISSGNGALCLPPGPMDPSDAALTRKCLPKEWDTDTQSEVKVSNKIEGNRPTKSSNSASRREENQHPNVALGSLYDHDGNKSTSSEDDSERTEQNLLRSPDFASMSIEELKTRMASYGLKTKVRFFAF
jgi:hypothetical protein